MAIVRAWSQLVCDQPSVEAGETNGTRSLSESSAPNERVVLQLMRSHVADALPIVDGWDQSGSKVANSSRCSGQDSLLTKRGAKSQDLLTDHQCLRTSPNRPVLVLFIGFISPARHCPWYTKTCGLVYFTIDAYPTLGRGLKFETPVISAQRIVTRRWFGERSVGTYGDKKPLNCCGWAVCPRFSPPPSRRTQLTQR